MRFGIHPLFFALALLLVLFGQAQAFLWTLAAVTLHEAGHAIAARMRGYVVRELTLYCGAGASVEATYELTNPLGATVSVECISHSAYQVAVDRAASKITVTAPADPTAVAGRSEILVFASDDERTIMRKLVIMPVNYITYTATEQLDITNADFPGDPYFWGRDCEFIAEQSSYDALTGEGRWAYVGTVTQVEPNAFNGSQAIRSLVLPEGITFIGDNAFNNSALESIVLPESLVDYVICHELAHLQQMNHGPKFHELCNRYCGGEELALRKQLRTFTFLF